VEWKTKPKRTRKRDLDGGERQRERREKMKGYYLMGILALANVGNSIGSRLDLVSVLVGDLDGELLLDSHDNLDSVQRVQTEIRVEVGLEGDL